MLFLSFTVKCTTLSVWLSIPVSYVYVPVKSDAAESLRYSTALDKVAHRLLLKERNAIGISPFAYLSFLASNNEKS